MKICMLFPGYGSQFVGMGKDLYDQSRTMQEYFEEASNCLNINFVKLCFASSDADLARAEHAYPALFLLGGALHAIAQEHGISPHLMAGYNQGEYTAAFAAGGFSFPDGLYLLSKYATLYQELLEQQEVMGITIQGLWLDEVNQLCGNATRGRDFARVAITNAPKEHVVLGTSNSIAAIRNSIDKQSGIKMIDADRAIGLHSTMMDPIAASLKMYAEKVDFKDLSVPLVTSADVKEVMNHDQVKAALIKQINAPILWAQIMEGFASYDLLLVMGPATHLQQLVREIYPDKACMPFNNQADIDAVLNIIHKQKESEQSTRIENDGV